MRKANHQDATSIANEVRAGRKIDDPDRALLVVSEAYAELQKKVGAFSDAVSYFDGVPLPSPELP